MYKQKPTIKQLSFERECWSNGKHYVAGVDEAGRGPLAGPVVAAAVVFPCGLIPFDVNDSKKLTPAKRDIVYDVILNRALSVGIGIVNEKIIDKINILQATYQAMRQAIAALEVEPDLIFVDGKQIPNLKILQTALVRGDGCCFSVAAASVVAKVTRDRIMNRLDREYPQYQFARHKGYPTKLHVERIRQFGRCLVHRTSFKIRTLKESG
ncbi:MAG TPA: ribonuclease HII [bacterium]|nr:ribonuclease HII [bacterium]